MSHQAANNQPKVSEPRFIRGFNGTKTAIKRGLSISIVYTVSITRRLGPMAAGVLGKFHFSENRLVTYPYI